MRIELAIVSGHGHVAVHPIFLHCCTAEVLDWLHFQLSQNSCELHLWEVDFLAFLSHVGMSFPFLLLLLPLRCCCSWLFLLLPRFADRCSCLHSLNGLVMLQDLHYVVALVLEAQGRCPVMDRLMMGFW